jgi:hypothetical protein
MRVVRVDHVYLPFWWLVVVVTVISGAWEGRNPKSTEICSLTVRAFSTAAGNHIFLSRVPVATLPFVRFLPEQRQNHQRHSATTTSMMHMCTRLELRMAPFGGKFASRPGFLAYPASLCLSSNDDDLYVEAEDFEALQALFATYCDSEGLITKKSFLSIPMIADLLVSGKRMRRADLHTWDVCKTCLTALRPCLFCFRVVRTLSLSLV